MTQRTISASDLRCQHCVQTVNAALCPMDGLRDRRVSLEAGQAEVGYHPGSTGVDQWVDAIERAGYHVAGERPEPANQVTLPGTLASSRAGAQEAAAGAHDEADDGRAPPTRAEVEQRFGGD